MLQAFQCEKILAEVVEEASRIFQECHAESDFCIKHVFEKTIVFGDRNRLRWSIYSGFSLDAAFCTEQFIYLYNKEN